MASATRLEWLDGEALFFDVEAQQLFRVAPEAARAWRPDDDARDDRASETRPQFDPPVGGACFRIATGLCGIAFADEELARAVRSIFGHLETESARCDLVITTERAASGYIIRSDRGDTIEQDAAAAAISLKAEMLEGWLARDRRVSAFHAAALASPAGAVVLAGASGQGKSTLAAMMHAQGCALIADDVVFLTEGSDRISGFATAFATKAASWPVLSPDFPELAKIEELTRPDGKTVRYLKPRAVDVSAKAARVLFPHFTTHAEFELRPMNRSDALVSLLSEARNGEHALSGPAFSTLCELLRMSRVESVSFGDASAAACAILGVI